MYVLSNKCNASIPLLYIVEQITVDTGSDMWYKLFNMYSLRFSDSWRISPDLRTSQFTNSLAFLQTP